MLGGYIKKDKLWFFTAFTPRFFTRNRAMDMTNWGGSGVNAYDRVEQSWNGSSSCRPSRPGSCGPGPASS